MATFFYPQPAPLYFYPQIQSQMAAVGSERVASVLGYELDAGNFSTTSPNLPQRVAVICPANHANNVTGLDVSEWQATNLKAVGDRYGYGSPAYLIAREALPILGGIPLVFYPQAEAGGSTAKQIDISPIGTATETTTHYVVIAGRKGIDGQSYAFTVNTGDNSRQINQKIEDAVAAVIGCPCSVQADDYTVILASKWKDATAEPLTVSIDTGGVDAGITYGISTITHGAGVPDISGALALMTPAWNTILINAYGTNATIADAIQTWNGRPASLTGAATGRYVGTIMKPLLAMFGFATADATAFTDPRKNEVTHSGSPMPLGSNFPFEMAADDAAGYAALAQDDPGLDVLNRFASDIVAPVSIGSMSDYNERDRIVKLGCSTVDLVNNQYQYKDPVTTFHPDGDLAPAWRWRRDLMVDFNLKFRYRLLEVTFLLGKIIAGDQDIVRNQNVIKPKDWKAIIINQLLKNAVADGLITDEEFSADSLVVNIDGTNPNRFNTNFDYKKTGVVRIASTNVRSGVSTFSA